MSKAEEEVNKRYSITRGDDTKETSGIDMQRASDFIDGYHQAEKDLGLTVDDIMKLDALLIEMWNRPSNEDKYQEVLKRFKDLKNVK